jgi:hypothetical protein
MSKLQLCHPKLMKARCGPPEGPVHNLDRCCAGDPATCGNWHVLVAGASGNRGTAQGSETVMTGTWAAKAATTSTTFMTNTYQTSAITNTGTIALKGISYKVPVSNPATGSHVQDLRLCCRLGVEQVRWRVREPGRWDARQEYDHHGHFDSRSSARRKCLPASRTCRSHRFDHCDTRDVDHLPDPVTGSDQDKSVALPGLIVRFFSRRRYVSNV